MSKLILITNDDGILSPSIQALRKVVSTEYDTILVAPDRERSAASHALTLDRPLRVQNIDETTMSVDGTPTDCVLLSLMGLLDIRPDLVISGINNGPNLGDDVIYSGTVAGAAESTVLGVPAIAASFVDHLATDLEWGAEMVLKVARIVFEHTLPHEVFLNVNIPKNVNQCFFEVTSLGRRSYRDVIVKKNDPRGRPYYWIGGHVENWSGPENCDFAAINRGNISITPLHLDMTAFPVYDLIESWDFNR